MGWVENFLYSTTAVALTVFKTTQISNHKHNEERSQEIKRRREREREWKDAIISRCLRMKSNVLTIDTLEQIVSRHVVKDRENPIFLSTWKVLSPVEVTTTDCCFCFIDKVWTRWKYSIIIQAQLYLDFISWCSSSSALWVGQCQQHRWCRQCRCYYDLLPTFDCLLARTSRKWQESQNICQTILWATRCQTWSMDDWCVGWSSGTREIPKSKNYTYTYTYTYLNNIARLRAWLARNTPSSRWCTYRYAKKGFHKGWATGTYNGRTFFWRKSCFAVCKFVWSTASYRRGCFAGTGTRTSTHTVGHCAGTAECHCRQCIENSWRNNNATTTAARRNTTKTHNFIQSWTPPSPPPPSPPPSSSSASSLQNNPDQAARSRVQDGFGPGTVVEYTLDSKEPRICRWFANGSRLFARIWWTSYWQYLLSTTTSYFARTSDFATCRFGKRTQKQGMAGRTHTKACSRNRSMGIDNSDKSKAAPAWFAKCSSLGPCGRFARFAECTLGWAKVIMIWNQASMQRTKRKYEKKHKGFQLHEYLLDNPSSFRTNRFPSAEAKDGDLTHWRWTRKAYWSATFATWVDSLVE